MKSTFRFFVVLIVVSMLFSGCAPAPSAPAAQPTAQPAAAQPTTAPQPAATAAQQQAATAAPQPTTPPAAAEEKAHLVIWWWGEQEAPGAQKWMDETVANYEKAHPNITIETVLQSTDALIPAFQSAASAKAGPDIQYFWGGVWTLENVWNGALVPLDDLIPADERAHYINNFERAFDGKQYGIGWYLSGNPMVFNPKLFTKAGLDPKNPPATWEDLKTACTKLSAIGVVPIAGGLKDGWFGGWLFSILARQSHDTEKEFMAASVGTTKFTDPSNAEWWSRLNELKTAGCWNKDINSLDYQQGQDMFVQGKAAMIFGNDTFLKGWSDTIGWDNMDVMMVPKWGTGKLADTYVVTAQGWGVTTWSKYPKQSADFLMYMHTPDRLNAWYQDTGVLPADDRLDPSQINQPILKKIFGWDSKAAGANLENFIPSMLDEQSNFAGTQLLFSGDKTPVQLAQMAQDVIQKWRDQNPDEMKNFLSWSK